MKWEGGGGRGGGGKEGGVGVDNKGGADLLGEASCQDLGLSPPTTSNHLQPFPPHLHVCPADVVQDLGLADIDVAQDATDGRAQRYLVGRLAGGFGAGKTLGLGGV